MEALHDLTALAQGRAIADGDLSALELTEYYLDRSAQLNDVVGAFAALLPELALEQARSVDKAAAAGLPAADAMAAIDAATPRFAAFMASLAQHAARHGKRVGIASAEMPAVQIGLPACRTQVLQLANMGL